MTNNQIEYSETDYTALGHFLRREIFGVILNEDEDFLTTMAILKFDNLYVIHKGFFPENMYAQRIEIEGKWGLISTDGWAVSPIYEWIDPFREGFSRVQRADGKWNHANTKGEFLSEEWWVKAGAMVRGFAGVQRAVRKYGYIDTKGIFYDERP
jgi:hypothetical protein